MACGAIPESLARPTGSVAVASSAVGGFGGDRAFSMAWLRKTVTKSNSLVAALPLDSMLLIGLRHGKATRLKSANGSEGLALSAPYTIEQNTNIVKTMFHDNVQCHSSPWVRRLCRSRVCVRHYAQT
jgi:hypothetical protein